jgi:hypothetical protein
MTEKHWHFQLMRHPDGELAIHEMYPLEYGFAWTEEPVSVTGSTVEDVKWMLTAMLNDIDRHGIVEYTEDEEQ